MALFRATTKSLGLCLLWFFCHCFVDGNNIHLRDFHHTHLNDIWLFQNRITGSFYHSFNRNILTRQTSEKVVYKPGLDYLLECFLTCTFAWIISALPEKFQKFLKLGGGGGGPPPHPNIGGRGKMFPRFSKNRILLRSVWAALLSLIEDYQWQVKFLWLCVFKSRQICTWKQIQE